MSALCWRDGRRENLLPGDDHFQRGKVNEGGYKGRPRPGTGEKLGGLLVPGDIVALVGAGGRKTVLVRVWPPVWA